MDYHLIYAANSLVGFQMYSLGLVEYANEVCSNSALEYVPGVVHVNLAAYRSWKDSSVWERFFKSPCDIDVAKSLSNNLKQSIENIRKVTYRFESKPILYYPAYIAALTEMMSHNIVTQKADHLFETIREISTKYNDMEKWINSLLNPGVTPYGVILITSALNAYIDPRLFSEFQMNSSFLRENDNDPELLAATDQEYIDKLGSQAGGKSGASSLLHKLRKQDRDMCLKRKLALEFVAKSYPEIFPAIIVWAGLVDHEELRHYWQERGSRNLKLLAKRARLQPMTCSVQDIETVSYTHLTLPTKRIV